MILFYVSHIFRLSTEFSYIFNCKPTGFHIDVISTNLNNVFVGVRIKLGMNSILQSPTYVELFHRKIQLHFVNDKPRWFDIAFTREESIHSIRNFQVNFGPSKDSNFHSYVNSFLVRFNLFINGIVLYFLVIINMFVVLIHYIYVLIYIPHSRHPVSRK